MKKLEDLLNERAVGTKIKVVGLFVYGYPSFTQGEVVLTAIATQAGKGVFYVSDDGHRFTPLDIVNRIVKAVEFL
ncbi:hypothetical protein [Paenibacillus taichungensis]|uniref:hypothetical protein n=1 Tax=Paenibacillus taichungensis TaxID=484184 RepID=UPI0039A0E04C